VSGHRAGAGPAAVVDRIPLGVQALAQLAHGGLAAAQVGDPALEVVRSGGAVLVFALPFSFEHEDYVQILTDMAEKLGPALGWAPTA
jgi:hypothetical protein